MSPNMDSDFGKPSGQYGLYGSGRSAHFDFWYPRIEPNADELFVGLTDVRAADSIRIRYDFDRDGWSIAQASVFEWPADDMERDSGWQEVAFIEAWGRQPEVPVEGEPHTKETP